MSINRNETIAFVLIIDCQFTSCKLMLCTMYMSIYIHVFIHLLNASSQLFLRTAITIL